MAKKAKIGLSIAAAIAVAAAIGVTVAFMFRRTDTSNTFAAAQVSCAIHEELDGAAVSAASAIGREKSNIRAENTGNVAEYLRVRVVSYFVDESGAVSGAVPSSYPALTLLDGWLAGKDHTYYYTGTVEPGESTPILCAPFTLSQKTTPDGDTVYQVVEVFAEAIQAKPDDAVREAWQVTVGDGRITAVPQ